MISNVIGHPQAVASADTSTADTIGGIVRQIAAGWRQARTDRAVHDAFADLDSMTLRDIGLGADEVTRAHAGEAFRPRAWQD